MREAAGPIVYPVSYNMMDSCKFEGGTTCISLLQLKGQRYREFK